MSASIRDLDPQLQPFAQYLVDQAGAAGLMPRVTSTRRSHAEQTRLYRASLSGGHAFPVARPGYSAHEYGFAFDMVVSPMSALPEVGAFWESLGGVWGGRFQSSAGGRLKGSAAYDPVHFEFPDWRSYVDFSQPDERAQLGDPLQTARQALKEVNPYGELAGEVTDLSLFGGGDVAFSIGEYLASFFK